MTAEERCRVAITGLGVVSPLGTGIEAAWSGLMEARSTARRITQFDASEFAVRISCPVAGFDPLAVMDHRDARRFDRLVQYAVGAARQLDELTGGEARSADLHRELIAATDRYATASTASPR